MLTIKIDTRETEIKEFFKNAHYAKIERLPLGDIIFQWNGVDIWIIERKQVSDLAHSIKDGRFREQKCLLSNYNSSQILYLIEGNLDLPLNTEVQKNMPVKTLYSSIYNMLLRDNLKVYKTSGMNETLRFLKNFVWKIQKQGNSFMKNYTIEDYHDSNMRMKLSKKKELDKPTCFMYQLCQIKGVSSKYCKSNSSKASSWISLYKALETHRTEYEKLDYISRIRVPITKKPETKHKKETTKKKKRKSPTSRKIGQVIGPRIYNFMFV